MSNRKSGIIMVSSDRLDALEHFAGEWLLMSYSYNVESIIHNAIEKSDESILEARLLDQTIFPKLIKDNPDLNIDYILDLMRAALKERYEHEVAQKSDSHDQLKD